jgi:hypothetical protein
MSVDERVAELQVDLAYVWEETSPDTGLLANLSLAFPGFATHDLQELSMQAQVDVGLGVQAVLAGELEELARERFAPIPIGVHVQAVRFGSLTLIAALTLLVGSTYTFFKDYEDLRKGIIQFSADVKSVAERLHHSAAAEFLRRVRSAQREKRARVKEFLQKPHDWDLGSPS